MCFRRWSGKTYQHMLRLWQSVDAGEAGVCLIAKYELSAEPNGLDQNLPTWSEVPLVYLKIDKQVTQKLSASSKYTYVSFNWGYCFPI